MDMTKGLREADRDRSGKKPFGGSFENTQTKQGQMAVMEYPADPGVSDSIPERHAVRSDDQRATSQHDRATSPGCAGAPA